MSHKKACYGKMIFILLLILWQIPAYPGSEDTEATARQQTGKSLPAALQQLSRQTGADIVFGDELAAGITVDCNFRGLPVEKALAKLLRGTGIDFKKVDEGFFVLYRHPENREKAVSGYVTDLENGKALPEANILLEGTNRGTASNANGHFVLSNIPQRSNSLQIDYIGYRPRTVDIELHQLSQPLRIALQQEPISLAGSEIQSANTGGVRISPTPGRISISADFISQLPVMGEKDALSPLRSLPGIHDTDDGSSLLYFRGGTPSHNIVTIDGIPVYRFGRAFGSVSIFDPAIIRDIEIYRSSYPAKYGGGLSGVIDLTSKTGDFNDLHLETGISPLGARAVMNIPLAGKGSWIVSGRKAYSQYLLNSLHERAFAPERAAKLYSAGKYDFDALSASSNAEMSYYDLFSKLTFMAGNKDIFSVSFYRNVDRIGDRQSLDNFQLLNIADTSLFDNLLIDFEKNTQWENIACSGKWLRQWNTGFQSTVQFSYSDYFSETTSLRNRNMRGGSVFNFTLNNAKVKDLVFQINNTWNLHHAHQLEFGARLSHSELSNHYMSQIERIVEFPDDANDVWLTTSFGSILSNDRHFERKILPYRELKEQIPAIAASQNAVYAQHTWMPAKSIEAIAGLRAVQYKENINNTKWQYLEPRVSLYYRLRPGIALKGAWGQYHQFFNRKNSAIWNRYIFYDEWWILAAGDRYEPGFAQHELVGGQFEYRDILLDVEIYRKKMRGLSEYSYEVTPQGEAIPVYNDASFSGQNFRGTGESFGFDVLLQKKSGSLTGWIGYSFNRTKIASPEKNFISGQERPHSVNIVGIYALREWHFSASWRYVSGKPYRDVSFSRNNFWTVSAENNGRLPADHQLDIGVSRDFAIRYFQGSLGLSVLNIYDRENVLYRDFYISPPVYDPAQKPDPVWEVAAPGITFMFFVELNLL